MRRTAETVEAFVVSRRAGECSPSYERWLRYGLHFLVEAREELPATPEPVEAVLAGLKEKRLGERTRYGVWLAFGLMYRWAADRYEETDEPVVNVMAKIRRKKPKPKQRETLLGEEVNQLLFVNARRVRESAMLRLFLDTGARVGEVYALQWRDVSYAEGEGYTVRLDGKTDERVVPIGAETYRALRQLEGDPMWRATTNKQVGYEGVKKIVQRALARAGLKGGPHLLRHTFAKLSLARGDSYLKAVQQMLGHSELATTEVYLGLNRQELSEQHAEFSPLAGHVGARQLRFGEELHDAGQGGHEVGKSVREVSR